MSPTDPRSETSTTSSKPAASGSTDEEALSHLSESEEKTTYDAADTQAPSKVQAPKSVYVRGTGSASTGPDLEASVSSPTDALSSSSADPFEESAKMIARQAIPTGTIPSVDTAAMEMFWSNLAAQVREAFGRATGEIFEDGKESAFTRKIRALVKTRGVEVVRLVANVILSGSIRPDIASEALRVIGRLRDPQTHDERRLLLQKALFQESPYIRDGAVSGIAGMRDPLSLPWLSKALENEQIEDLRDEMKRVIERLQDKR